MSGKDTPEQGIIYQFDEGRGRQVILDLLGPDFEGSLHADMYGAYVEYGEHIRPVMRNFRPPNADKKSTQCVNNRPNG